jgi:hypothetical protein
MTSIVTNSYMKVLVILGVMCSAVAFAGAARADVAHYQPGNVVCIVGFGDYFASTDYGNAPGVLASNLPAGKTQLVYWTAEPVTWDASTGYAVAPNQTWGPWSYGYASSASYSMKFYLTSNNQPVGAYTYADLSQVTEISFYNVLEWRNANGQWQTLYFYSSNVC